MTEKEEVENERLIFDETIALKDNAMLKHRPELYDEWDFEKNEGINIYDVTAPSKLKAWWNCPKCESGYDSLVYNRVGNNCNCSYCAGKKINHTNSLAALNPSLASQWHPTKNAKRTPHMVSLSSSQKAWWLGECGHEWDAQIGSRTKGNGCPVCNNKKILIGFNDMWTTNPDMASLLLNPEDGYKYAQFSGKRVDWKCPDCEQINKNKAIEKVKVYSLCCRYCSDGFKFPEKFMMNFLLQLNVEFDFQKTFDWSEGKIYDFYIPSLNMIIETHGGQHFIEQGYRSVGGRTLNDEQENDKIKERNAKQNGIAIYTVIDCRRSTLDYIKTSILKSKLVNFYELDAVNWNLIVKNANSSRLVHACEFYKINKRTINLKEMSILLNLDMSTLNGYLKKGAQIKLCDYKVNDIERREISKKHITRNIVQLDLDGDFIANWNSAADIARSFNKKDCTSVIGCCRGRGKTAYGFKWMYKEDYDKLINQKEIG